MALVKMISEIYLEDMERSQQYVL